MSEPMNAFLYKYARIVVHFLRPQKEKVYKHIIYPVLGVTPGVGSFLRNKMMNRWLADKEVLFMSQVVFHNEKEQKEFFFSLATKDLLSVHRVFFALGNLQKEKIQKEIDPHKKTVALYFSSGAYRENTGTIASRLRSKGYNVLILIGKVVDDEYEKQQEYVYYAGNDIINELDFIDVLIEISGTAEKLTRTKKIYFPHDIYDSPLGNTGNKEGIGRHMAECDYLFLPSLHVSGRCTQLISSARKKFPKVLHENQRVCLIPGGYIKLDKNLEYFKEHKKESKTLIYAPTVSKERMGGMGSVASLAHGESIIGALLENFKEYQVIFRPHPHDVHTAQVREIVAKHAGHPRFVFDDNASSYMENYAKAALLITDMSGTAYTYAFTTLQPVVFFSHDEPETQKRFGEFTYFADREKIGSIAHTAEEMVQQAQHLLATGNEWSERIKKHRDALVYNIGKAEDYFVENFEYIIEDKKHPDWVYI